MIRLSNEVVSFFLNAGFVIVSTIDRRGRPHNACKGIVKINTKGAIYLLDLYLKDTYKNLKNKPYLAITAVDEHRFKGYCIKGKAKILEGKKLRPELLKAWEERIASRLTQRLLKNIREEKGHPGHPEALLPKPEYIIFLDAQEVIDLTPHHLRSL